MYWIVLVLGTIVMMGSLALGVYIGRQDSRKASLWACIGVAIVLVRLAGRFWPQYEFLLFNNNWYSYLRTWWAMPAGLMVLGIAVFHVHRRWLRMTAEVCAGLTLLYVFSGMYETATLDYSKFEGVVDESGVCQQTTPFSCGAAAAASFLHFHGVPTTEREMARLCGTNTVTGTDEFSVARGLRQKLPDSSRVMLHKGGWGLLTRESLPALATMKLAFLVDHWVVITGKKGNKLTVADPLQGLTAMDQAEFLSRWRGVLLHVERQ